VSGYLKFQFPDFFRVVANWFISFDGRLNNTVDGVVCLAVHVPVDEEEAADFWWS